MLALESNGTSHKSGSFTITGAEGLAVQIPAGEYYFNTKARCRRLMQNSLSSDARRVYACLEAATMFWKRELALANNGQPLTPTDIVEQTGLIKQHVTAALRELEEQGLAERRSDDGGELRRGHILIYSWAIPQPPQEEDSNCAQLQSSLQFPDWFPESWESLKPLIKRLRVRLDTELVTARSSIIEEGAEIARCYEEAEKRVRALLERVSAQDDLYKEDRKYKTTDKTEDRGGRETTSSVEEPEQPRSSPHSRKDSPPDDLRPPAQTLRTDDRRTGQSGSRTNGPGADANPEGNKGNRQNYDGPAKRGVSKPHASSSRDDLSLSSRYDAGRVGSQGVAGLDENLERPPETAVAVLDPRRELVVANPNSTELFEIFCLLMEGSGRPVSVRSVDTCRQVFFRYPPETQQRIVDDATIRSQGKWRGSEYTPAPLKYLNSEIWDIEPITARKFAPAPGNSKQQQRDDALRQLMERSRTLDRDLGPLR